MSDERVNGHHAAEEDPMLQMAVDRLKSAQETAREVRQQLEEANADVQRYTKILRALAPEHELAEVPERTPGGRPTGQRGRPPKRNYYGAAINLKPETLDAVWQWIKEEGADGFTVPQAIEGLEGWVSHEPVRRAIVMLRDGEGLRIAGKRGQADYYRIMDEDAAQRALEANRSAYTGRGRPTGGRREGKVADEELRQRFKQLRKTQDMSQAKAAAETGASPDQIHRFERGGPVGAAAFDKIEAWITTNA